MITFLISAIKIIILLGVLITIHELGHFIVAKLCKIKVNEFAIGFGPAIWRKQGKETKYTLRMIPLGGYNSMEGEDEKSDDDRSFSKASIPKRMAIVVAGATVNIVFAIFIYFILATTSGTYISNEIEEILDGYAAQTAGLQAGDKIIEGNGKKIKSKKDLNEVLEKSQGKEIEIKIKRNGEIKEYNIKPTEVKSKELTPDYESSYYLGVNLKQAEDTFFNRCINAGMQTERFLLAIIDNLKQLFTGNVRVEQMMGVVGISNVVAKTNGVREFFEMMALISLSLGVTNLLPIPALDGGKILILFIEAIRRKPMKQETEVNIQLLGFAFLIALSLYVTYNDILRIF